MFDLIVIVYSSHISNIEHAIYVFKTRQTKSSLDFGRWRWVAVTACRLCFGSLAAADPMLTPSGIRRVRLEWVLAQGCSAPYELVLPAIQNKAGASRIYYL